MEPMTILFIISLTLTIIGIIGAIGTYIWRLWHPKQKSGPVRELKQKFLGMNDYGEHVGDKGVAQPEPLTTEDVQRMYERQITPWVTLKARNAALRDPSITKEVLIEGKNDFLKLFDRGIDKGNAQDKSFSEAIHKLLDKNDYPKRVNFGEARRDKIVQTVLNGQGQ